MIAVEFLIAWHEDPFDMVLADLLLGFCKESRDCGVDRCEICVGTLIWYCWWLASQGIVPYVSWSHASVPLVLSWPWQSIPCCFEYCIVFGIWKDWNLLLRTAKLTCTSLNIGRAMLVETYIHLFHPLCAVLAVRFFSHEIFVPLLSLLSLIWPFFVVNMMHLENSFLGCLFKNNTHRQFLFAIRISTCL